MRKSEERWKCGGSGAGAPRLKQPPMSRFPINARLRSPLKKPADAQKHVATIVSHLELRGCHGACELSPPSGGAKADRALASARAIGSQAIPRSPAPVCSRLATDRNRGRDTRAVVPEERPRKNCGGLKECRHTNKSKVLSSDLEIGIHNTGS